MAVISIKFINPCLYTEKLSFLVSGCRISYASMLVFNFESVSNIIMHERNSVTEVLPSCFHRRSRCPKITITLGTHMQT
jgi:hypothetical protein